MRKVEAVGKGKSYEPGHCGKVLKGDEPLVIVMGKWYNSIRVGERRIGDIAIDKRTQTRCEECEG